jgi:hypothetical protein
MAGVGYLGMDDFHLDRKTGGARQLAVRKQYDEI